MWRLILLPLVILAGVWFGKMKSHHTPSRLTAQVDLNTEFPLVEQKAFVVVLYSHNQAAWCKRALRSLFEQDYPHYRIVMIDDASLDGTEEIAKEFVLEANQSDRVSFIRHEAHLGPVASLYRAIHSCLDKEIVLPLEAKDWLTSPDVFSKLNQAYQNPDVWMASGWAIEYPAYKMREEGPISYYASLFKQLRPGDLSQQGHFARDVSIYVRRIKALASGREKRLSIPVCFFNLYRN